MTFEQLPLHFFSNDIKKTLKKGLTRGVIFGNFGACNTGDEAILAGELREISKISGTHITIMSRYPKRVKQLHGVASVSITSPLKSLITLFRSDYVVLGGGGLYCKIDTGIRGVIFQLYTTFLFLYLPLFLQKNIIVTGIGFYSNTNKIIARLALLALRHVQTVGVRDDASYKFLQKNRVKAYLYKDNSYLMPLQIEKKTALKTYHKLYRVGLALNKPKNEDDSETLLKEITEFIKYNRASTHFVFYALDFHPFYSNDRRFANKILKLIDDPSVSYEFYPPSHVPNEIFASFAQMDYMIVSRLHGSIFSYRSKIPFYAISYDTKCESFLKKIGHQFVVPRNVSFLSINEQFESAKKIKVKSEFLHPSLFERGIST